MALIEGKSTISGIIINNGNIQNMGKPLIVQTCFLGSKPRKRQVKNIPLYKQWTCFFH